MKVKTKPIAWKDLTEGIEINIPIPEQSQKPTFHRGGMTDLWKHKVTIYNDIPADAVNARRFDRFVIDKCHIVTGRVPKADGTIENLINGKTIETKDVERYKTPFEYRKTPIDLAEEFYTVQIGDFVVEGEVDDVVTTSREFAALQEKYNEIGFVVRTVSENIYGMSVDNITMANVG